VQPFPAVRREQLPPAQPRQREDVLKIWRGGRDPADHRRVERAAGCGDESEQPEARGDLEEV
jgi:hypothetical protein